MAEGVREKMIAGAVRLLAQQGLQATSFSEVLALTGAPRGSIYRTIQGHVSQEYILKLVEEAKAQNRPADEVARSRSPETSD